MAVATPLHVEEMVYLFEFRPGSCLIVSIHAAVPPCPDGGRVDIDDVLTEIAPADGRFAGRVELMGKIVQFLHERSYFLLVELFKIARPVVFIPQPPDNDRGVIVMLLYHIGQHPSGLRFINLAAQSTAAPRYFFPYQYTQAIARFQDDTRLLVMPKSNEIDT